MAALDNFFSNLSQRILGPRKPTNADAVIGTAGIVVEEINPLKSTGRVIVDGISWKARSSTGDLIPNGKTVQVLKIVGASLIVTPIN